MKPASQPTPEIMALFEAQAAPALQLLHSGGPGASEAAGRDSFVPGPQWPDLARQEPSSGSARRMRDADDHPRALGGLPLSTALAAARSLDLSASRRLVYVGGDGAALAAFLDTWRQLTGVWFGPAYARDGAQQFMRRLGLADRMRYVIGDTLDAIRAGDLVVLTAADAAVERSLQFLVSAGPGWLPAEGKWLILKRESPHLSAVVDPPLLQGQGLRVASMWPLSAGVHMLVCAPAHRFAEVLGSRAGRLTA